MAASSTTASSVPASTSLLPGASPDLPSRTARKSPSQQPPRKRSRTNDRDVKASSVSNTSSRRKKACQTCCIRKVKCNAARPICASCKLTKSECVYTEREKLTLETATDLLARRLDRIDARLEGLHTAPRHIARERSGETQLVLEPSKDFLQMPAQKTSCDTVLTWPIFGNRYPFNTLTDALFQHDADGLSERPVMATVDLPSEERIPGLVDRFLSNVHTKNPILDVELLIENSRRMACEGFDWTADSCLVLLACALGSIAEPFNLSMQTADSPRSSLTNRTERALQQGECYFRLASYRLGTLKPTLVGIQCHFYAGVYGMYTLRPLMSYQYFMNSSTLYQLYDKMKYGPGGRVAGTVPSSVSRDTDTDHRSERLEQSLYWSCFKSESEFRVELPLAMTEIGSHHHPDMFPIPPTPQEHFAESPNQSIDPAQPPMPSPYDADGDRMDVMSPRYQARRLCNEEESWYYYLTEIALRRIGNRVVNTFFRQEPEAWLNIKPLLRIAVEFDVQVSSWSANLPPAMQHWQMTYTIRDPHLGSLESGNASYVSQELSWALENRLLEVRSWLYQPFLYYLIHHDHHPDLCELCNVGRSSPGAWTVSSSHTVEASHMDDETVLLHRLISSGIDSCMTILDSRALHHRHHGLWYDLRSLMCASLILVAIVKSGHESWIPEGPAAIWGAPGESSGSVGGKIGRVLAHYRVWEKESPDMVRHREVLEAITLSARHSWLRGNRGSHSRR